MVRIVVECPAQLVDAGINGAGFHRVTPSPDLVQQTVTGDDLLAVQGEILQHTKGAGGKWQQAFSQPGLAGLTVEHELTTHQFAAGCKGRGTALDAAQDGLYAGDQFKGFKGLVEIIIGAFLQAESALSGRATRVSRMTGSSWPDWRS